MVLGDQRLERHANIVPQVFLGETLSCSFTPLVTTLFPLDWSQAGSVYSDG